MPCQLLACQQFKETKKTKKTTPPKSTTNQTPSS